ncbi:MAG: hypothetical protein IKI85_01455 [Bacteroidales bacterium]|nr:hypothetical protein [Bacteroidales bacterium]
MASTRQQRIPVATGRRGITAAPRSAIGPGSTAVPLEAPSALQAPPPPVLTPDRPQSWPLARPR